MTKDRFAKPLAVVTPPDNLVYKPVDVQALMRRCLMSRDEYLAEGVNVLDGEQHVLIHQDNNSTVLAVAHLDFVGDQKPSFGWKIAKNGDRYVYTERLDDRLGVYIVLDYLKSIGVTCDVLLTDNEERGQSTAKRLLYENHPYNWIFSFDRSGTGVVLYQYETAETVKLMKEYDFNVETGSYSCIKELEKLGVSGFNFGTGYYRQHCDDCYASLNEVEHAANKFAKLFHAMKDTKLVHSKEAAEEYRKSKPYAYNTVGSWYKNEKGEWLQRDFIKDKPWTPPTGGTNTTSKGKKQKSIGFDTPPVAGGRKRFSGLYDAYCDGCYDVFPESKLTLVPEGDWLCDDCVKKFTAMEADLKASDRFAEYESVEVVHDRIHEMSDAEWAVADAAYERMKSGRLEQP